MDARWRRIAERLVARRMAVYDFDDTLVSSSSSVTVKHGDGEETILDSASFAYFKPVGGDRIDFGDFNNVTRPRIIRNNMEAFKQAAGDGGTRTVVLTARPKGSASAVKRFLDHLGLKDVEVVALQSSDPMDKARWIEHEAGEEVEEVEFVDDSSRNVAAVATLEGKLKAKVVTKNPPHPKEDDYEGDEIGEVFESESPTRAEVEVEGEPDQEDEPDQEVKTPHGTSPWWRKQSPEFKTQYCKDHKDSPYCRGMAARSR